jgi:hypothetical protein
MSDSEWVKGITELLKQVEGHREKRLEVLDAARSIDHQFPTKGEIADHFRGWFRAWVEHMGYMVHLPSAVDRMPMTLLRSDGEVRSEYGLSTEKGIREKQRQLAANREERIERFIRESRGCNPLYCLHFLGARDEYDLAMEKMRAQAHIGREER